MSTAVKAALCVRCRAARAASAVHTAVIVTRTSEDVPDVRADRDHRMTVTTWTSCSSCPGGTR